MFTKVAVEELNTLVPIHCDIELTTRCNLECEMCPFHSPLARKRKEADMDLRLYEKIIDELAEKGCESVKLNFGGESLLYPYFYQAVSYASSLGLEVQLNTNGLLLTNKMCEDIVKGGLDLLILSDYGKDKQFDNLKRLVSFREALGSVKPRIRVKADRDEKWLGLAEEVETVKYYDYLNLEENFDTSGFKCTQPWQRFLVLVNGDVMACSCGFTCTEKFIGNVITNSIENLWGSREMAFLRKCHSSGASHLVSYCRKCPYRNENIEGWK